jgi:hypothetical protein
MQIVEEIKAADIGVVAVMWPRKLGIYFPDGLLDDTNAISLEPP